MERETKILRLKDSNARKEPSNKPVAGRYLLKGNPRRGGIASVYRALDLCEERTVAVKVFRASVERDDVVEESFRRETRALSDLRHPNIIEILDSGVDEDSGEHFIVMEWVEKALDAYRGTTPLKDWNQLFNAIGRPVLEALAFAHTHVTVHRDIKLSNILITPEDIPKVCDFGISKIRNFLEPGVTLAHYASFPFSPPESDDGSYSYTRDVFGFAALCVSLLAPQVPHDHKQLLGALEGLDVDGSIRRLLQRCLSLACPSDRPLNAAVLLSEFDRLSPRPKPVKEGNILLAITNTVRGILKVDVGAQGDVAAQNFIVKDLADARVLMDNSPSKGGKQQGQPSGLSYLLYGSRYGYRAVISEKQDRLLLISAPEYPTSRLEEKREVALDPVYAFGFSGTSPTLSRLNINTLLDHLVEFTADQKARAAERRSQAIYNTWLDLPNAKTELEHQRRQRVQYTACELSGATLRFAVAEGVETGFLDGQDVRIPFAGNVEFLGSVVSISEDSVLVSPNERNEVELDEPPTSGVLIVDTNKADASLSKQKTALDAVRYGKSVNPALGSMIVSPDSVKGGHPVDVEFIQPNIDEDKKEAVRVALSKPDLLVIQGPPETGKTTLITEIVLQTLKREPESRILLTSQTHVALDNSL